MEPVNQETTPDAGKSPPIDPSTSDQNGKCGADASDAHKSPNHRTVAEPLETPGNDGNLAQEAEKSPVTVPERTVEKKPAKRSPFSIDHLLSDSVGSTVKAKEHTPDCSPPLHIDLTASPEPPERCEKKTIPNAAPLPVAVNQIKFVAKGEPPPPQQKKPPVTVGLKGALAYRVLPREKGEKLQAPMKLVLTRGATQQPRIPPQNPTQKGQKFFRYPAVPAMYRRDGPPNRIFRLVVGQKPGSLARGDKASPSSSVPPSKGPPSSVAVKPLPVGASAIRVIRRTPFTPRPGIPPPAATTKPAKTPGASLQKNRVPVVSSPRWFPTTMRLVPQRAATVSPAMKVVKRVREMQMERRLEMQRKVPVRDAEKAPPILSQPNVSLPGGTSFGAHTSPLRHYKRVPYRLAGQPSGTESSDESTAAKKPKLSPEDEEKDDQKKSVPAPNPQQQKKPPYVDTEGLWVACMLCDNHIMTSRMTNLTNHAKRHCAIKQFACLHCNYQHNEAHKVRMHMFSFHNDSKGTPKNNYSKALEKTWHAVLKECFPDCAGLPGSALVPKRMGASHHICNECNLAIAPLYDAMVLHLTRMHPQVCICYRCSCCGYSNPDEGIVSWHIHQRHSHVCYAVDVEEKQLGSNMDIFLHKYFPSVIHCLPKPLDKEEARFMAESAAVKYIWYAGTKGHRRPFIRPIMRDIEGNPSLPINFAVERLKEGEGEKKEREGEKELKEEELEEDDEESLIEVVSEGEDPSPVESKKVERYDANDTEGALDLRPLCKITRAPVDRSALGPHEIVCELCEKVLLWTNTHSLAAPMGHAKRHFRIKQYECPVCAYKSSEAAHVRTHISRKHNCEMEPKENNDEFMQKSWLRVMKKCFPQLIDRIDAFRFKSRKDSGAKEAAPAKMVKVEPKEQEMEEAPQHNYGTRRKKRQEAATG